MTRIPKPPVDTPHGRFLPLVTLPGGREDQKGVLLPPRLSMDVIEKLIEEGATECCVPDSPPPLSEIILDSPCLVAFWKLNEVSGDIAEDSGPGGLDMDSGSYGPPTWASAVPPFDTAAPLFGDNLGESRTSFSALSGDLTIEIWFKRGDLNHGELIGQGRPESSNTSGVSLAIGAFNEGAFNRPKVFIGDTTGGPHGFEADTAVTVDGEWHHLAVTRASHIWTLYLDGEAQSGTYDDSGTNYNTPTGVWVGNNPSDVTQLTNFVGNLSYAAVHSCALTADQIAEHYTVGIAGGGIPDGYVLTADSTAEEGWSWQPATIEWEF